jgi:hypothetical protein
MTPAAINIRRILLLAAALAAFTLALRGEALPASQPASLEAVRIGYNREGVRLALDLSGKATWQVHSVADSSKISIDIFDTRLADGFRPPQVMKNNLLKRCLVKQHNFRQVTVELYLSYGVPIDNVSFFALDEPARLVVDVARDYRDFIQFNITRNVVWSQTERAVNGAFILINELFVDHRSPGVDVRIEMARGPNDRETICSMVTRTGAVGGVNGGYFSKGGQSLGLLVMDGKIAASSVRHRPSRTAFGIDSGKNVLIDRVIDRAGKLITISGRTWKDVMLAVGAGPRLIKGGRIKITANEEGLGKSGNNITRKAGRTALGVNRKGQMVLMTASSFEDNHKDGLKLEEMAAHMLSRDVVDALNLDGGGSTAMSIMGTLVSKPPMQGKYQRPVTNGLLIFDKSPVISPCYMGIDPPSLVLPADGETSGSIKILVTDRDENPVPDRTPLCITPGVGLFGKKYYYTKNGIVDIKVKSLRLPGNYSIKVDCGPVRKFIPIKLEDAEPVELLTLVKRAGPEKKGSEDGKGEKEDKSCQFLVMGLLRDAFGNPLPRRAIRFTLMEGKGAFSQEVSLTRPNGEADANLTLEEGRGRIQLVSEGLEPVVLEFEEGKVK